MKAIAVQLRTSCSTCGSPLPLDALVPRLACPACSQDNRLSDAFWTAVLGDADLSSGTIITHVGEAARAHPSYPRFNLWKALLGG